MRFFLLDKVKSLEPQKAATAIKCWSLDNEIFKDHFPGYPTVPGVLLTESMAQLAGLLISKSLAKVYNSNEKVYPILSIIQKAKFRAFVRPGDQCLIEAKLLSIERMRANVEVTTFVKDSRVCEAKLSFVIGKDSDMADNPYLTQMEEYYYMILSNKD